jgi:putative peptidoglycan lipid II flippase
LNTRFSARVQSLAGAAILISVVTLLSRLLGFARSIAQATWVGTGGVAEPYAIANQLPNVLFEVAAGGALAGAVITLLAGALTRDSKVDLSRISSALLTWTLAVLVPIALVVFLFASPIVSAMAHMRTEELHTTAVFFLRVFALQIPLYGVGILFGGILQAHKRFLWPALAPLFSSLTVIVTYFVFGLLADGNQSDVSQLTVQALQVLAWGTTAGVAAMALTMVGPVRSLGLKFRLSFRFPHGQGTRARALAFAGVGALVAQQFTMLVVMRMASHYGQPETFNLFQYSQAVYVLPYAVLVVPIATSAFPRIAEFASRKMHADFARMVSSTTRTIIALAALSSAILIAAAEPLEAFFATFTRGSVDFMAETIASAAPGLIGYALILQLSRVLYSVDRGRAAVGFTAAGWFVAALFSVILPIVVGRPQWTVALLGAAQAIGMSVAGIGLLYAVRSCCGPQPVAGVLRTSLTTISAAGLAGAAGYLVAYSVLPAGASLLVSIAVGVLAACVAIIVFATLTYALDRATVRSALASLRRRGNSGKANEVPSPEPQPTQPPTSSHTPQGH